ncbi:aminoglycoside phosphotransferase family protein [Nocardia ninae]|uniref:Aminoglycoside phosphotransferase n=1 Tax=Nocardia ninae NBRC 108245 TaxID=1210091 RepID=A0A511MIJ6_9NOCA|nr:aminoglycoside phosphotransferase family protein [Nocardia ninae]GEM39928.1 aminoglycoside phosphotransferase [Nocardia ninae NBRC 108245]
MATKISPRRAAELHDAVAEACARMDLDAAGAELIKYTVNAVYRLRTPIIVRVGSGDIGHHRGRRLVEMARWLQDQGAPIVQLLAGEQPIHVGDQFTVTLWHELTTRENWTAAQLANPLHALHSLAIDDSLQKWNPFDNARRRLADADPGLPSGDVDWLRDQWLAIEQDYLALQTFMPMGIIHGDPHTGNLLLEESGRIVLCDLDETGIGPLAWDLVPQAVGAARFDRAGFYAQFVDAYGSDVREEPYWPVLARIRELIMVTSVLPDLGHRPDVAAEHAHRLSTLRSGCTAAIWHRYQ